MQIPKSILDYLSTSQEAILGELKSYLAFPSISGVEEHRQDCLQCASFTAELMRKAGLEEVSLYPTSKGEPIVFGSWTKAPGKPTVLIYGHYDVQPVDPIEEWTMDPFKAWVEGDRIVARGSADDKGQLFMHFKALEACFRIYGGFPINIKVIAEGQEEIGSPDLKGFLREYRERLSCDVAIVSDTMMWGENMPSITYGLRGIVYVEVEAIGPNRDLHSGSYGGAVANPAEWLARLIASAKDDRGRILIPGFYDRVRPISNEERARLNSIPFDEERFKEDLGVEALWGEDGYTTLERLWTRPTLEINGIWGGFTGVGSKTVLPARAHAKISARLVPDQRAEEIKAAIEQFFFTQAPPWLKLKFTHHHGGDPVLLDVNHNYFKAAVQALEETFRVQPLYIREGGSIPIVSHFKEVLGVDTLLVGFALPDARAHSPNENLHLPTFWKGIESLARLYHLLAPSNG